MASVSAVCVVLLAAILVHELGHYTAAMALDFEVLGISVPSLRCDRLHGQLWRCYFPGSHHSYVRVSAVPRLIQNNLWSGMLVAIGAGSGPFADAEISFVLVLDECLSVGSYSCRTAGQFLERFGQSLIFPYSRSA